MSGTYADVRALVDLEFECDCAETVLRYVVCRNDTRQYKRQCLRCGRCGNPLAHATLGADARIAAAPVDAEAQDRWEKARGRRLSELWAERQPDRRARYEEYLQTPGWRARSRARLERDGRLCQAALPGCLGSATQVHHLTYEHVDYDHPGREPLFDLVSVCECCHRQITEMDARRGRTAP